MKITMYSDGLWTKSKSADELCAWFDLVSAMETGIYHYSLGDFHKDILEFLEKDQKKGISWSRFDTYIARAYAQHSSAYARAYRRVVSDTDPRLGISLDTTPTTFEAQPRTEGLYINTKGFEAPRYLRSLADIAPLVLKPKLTHLESLVTTKIIERFFAVMFGSDVAVKWRDNLTQILDVWKEISEWDKISEAIHKAGLGSDPTRPIPQDAWSKIRQLRFEIALVTVVGPCAFRMKIGKRTKDFSPLRRNKFNVLWHDDSYSSPYDIEFLTSSHIPMVPLVPQVWCAGLGSQNEITRRSSLAADLHFLCTLVSAHAGFFTNIPSVREVVRIASKIPLIPLSDLLKAIRGGDIQALTSSIKSSIADITSRVSPQVPLETCYTAEPEYGTLYSGPMYRPVLSRIDRNKEPLVLDFKVNSVFAEPLLPVGASISSVVYSPTLVSFCKDNFYKIGDQESCFFVVPTVLMKDGDDQDHNSLVVLIRIQMPWVDHGAARLDMSDISTWLSSEGESPADSPATSGDVQETPSVQPVEQGPIEIVQTPPSITDKLRSVIDDMITVAEAAPSTFGFGKEGPKTQDLKTVLGLVNGKEDEQSNESIPLSTAVIMYETIISWLNANDKAKPLIAQQFKNRYKRDIEEAASCYCILSTTTVTYPELLNALNTAGGRI